MSNDNTINLIGYAGSDHSHCVAAWASTNVNVNIILCDDINERVEQLYQATASNKKKTCGELLDMLASSHHDTPSEHSWFMFQVTSDISTHIHFLKHRIGLSINSESARYKELVDKWYIPDELVGLLVSDRSWPYDSELLSGIFSQLSPIQVDMLKDFIKVFQYNHGITWEDVFQVNAALGHLIYHTSIPDVTKVSSRSRAKELCRLALPYGKQIDYFVTMNFRSLMHFQGLRNSDHAQKEVQTLAQSALDQVRATGKFNDSLKAWRRSLTKSTDFDSFTVESCNDGVVVKQYVFGELTKTYSGLNTRELMTKILKDSPHLSPMGIADLTLRINELSVYTLSTGEVWELDPPIELRFSGSNDSKKLGNP